MVEALPAFQSGYRVHRWGSDPLWEEFECRKPGLGEAMVRVDACGVGLTVLNSINGGLSDSPSLLPVVPGHEIVGSVIGTGPDVSPDLVDRRFVAYFYLSCGSCPECSAGHDSICRRMTGWIGVHRDGGYAPYVVLPVANLVSIPASLDPILATVVPDAVATPVHVANRARIGEGDRVVVLGAGGGVGIHMIQVAALRGAVVVGLDVTDEKLAAIEELGAHAVDSSDFSSLPALFGSERPSVVVDLVGTTEASQWSIEALGAGGRLVALTTSRNSPKAVEHRDLVFRELTLLGSRYAAKSEVADAARLVGSGAVRPVIGASVGPGGVLELHSRLRSQQVIGRGVLDWSV